MIDLFSMYLQASLWGGVLILAVVFFRGCLNKVPRWILCMMWLLVALRLLLPFQLQSPVSLQPDTSAVTEVLVQEMDSPEQIPDVSEEEKPLPAPESKISETAILATIWLGVSGFAMLHAVCTYLRLRRKLRNTVEVAPGVREGSIVPSAFVLGYIHPVIYISSDMDERVREFALAHERAHIARADHWWKLLGYLCCCIHWFNPMVWIGYVLFCRDIEYACDEKVVGQLNLEQRKEYSLSLLYCGTDPGYLTAYPVPFVEGGLKRRVRKVLTMKRATPWVYMVGLIAVALTAVFFLTTPVMGVQLPSVPQFLEEQTEPTETPEPTLTTEPTRTTVPEETEPEEIEPEETEPAETKPKPKKPKPTEPATPSKPAKPAVSGAIPEAVQRGDTAPGADTATHVHAYTMKVQTPTCLNIGYTVNTCACGHVYYNGFRSAFGHAWELESSREATATKDGGNNYQCARCGEQRWEVTQLAGYKTFDLSGVDKELTAYAASLGFRTAESQSNRNVRTYTVFWDIDTVYRNGGRDILLNEGKSFVHRALSDCRDAGEKPEDCVIWVEFVLDYGLTMSVYCAV